MKFEGAVGEFDAMVGADAPVFVEAPEGIEDNAIGPAENRVIVEVSVVEGEFEIGIGHEIEGGGDFVEIALGEEGELGFEIEGEPGDGLPAEVVVEIGEVAVEFGIFEESIEVGVEDEPWVG